MNKIKAVGLLLLGIVSCYAVLAIFIKFLADQTVATNTALDTAHNMSLYPGTSGFLLSIPWVLYIMPAVVGIIWLIIILKKREVS